MSKPSTNRVKMESWSLAVPKSELHPEGRKVVAKVAVRDHLGRFHGATNFKGSVVG